MTLATAIADGSRRFTKNDLIAQARLRGYEVTERLITDWVENGLLDQPERHGLGRGKGSIATWSDWQRQLFLGLLWHRRSNKSVQVLCNVPVWAWLFFGDHFVPLRQVRRALRKWSETATSASKARGTPAARELVDSFAHPQASARSRKRLEDAVVSILLRGKFEPKMLLPHLRQVVDPLKTRQPRGPIGAQVSAEDLLDLFRVRYRAILRLKYLDGEPAIPDALFHWAHMFYLKGTHSYLLNQPTFARDPDLGHLFGRPDLDTIVNRAAIDLVSLLGLALTRTPGLPDASIDNPKIWVDHNLQADVIETRICPDEVEVGLRVHPAGARTLGK